MSFDFNNVLSSFIKFPVMDAFLPSKDMAKALQFIQQISKFRVDNGESGSGLELDFTKGISELLANGQNIEKILSGQMSPIQAINMLTAAGDNAFKNALRSKDPINRSIYSNDSTKFARDPKTGYIYHEKENRNGDKGQEDQSGDGSPVPTAKGPYIEGRYYGKNQQCASLTKYFCPQVGAASTWSKGQKVRGSSIPEGTPIATFNFNGKYGPPSSPGGQSGSSHTGIYLSQDGSGIKIFHQWSGSGGAKKQTIPWDHWSSSTLEAGDKYYTIT